MLKCKFPLSEADLDALASVVDLAANAISDAEFDHQCFTGRQRRNGGYSADLRRSEKLLLRMKKELDRQNK